MKTSLLITAIVLTAALVACGPAATPTPVPPTPAPVVLKYWYPEFGDPNFDKFVEGQVAAFEAANPGIKVEISRAPFEAYDDKVKTATAAGAGPDVFDVDIGAIASYALEGFLTPLDEYLPAGTMDDFVPAAKRAITIGGKVYGLPVEINNLQLFYNKDLFKAAGLDPEKPPKTWDEMLNYAQKLTVDKDKDGRIDQFGIELPTEPDEWFMFVLYPFITGAGGAVIDAQGNVVFDSDAAAEGLQFWADLFAKHKVAPSQQFMGVVGKQVGFESGVSAMTISGPWNLPVYANLEQTAGLHWGVAPFPVGRVPSTALGGWVMAVPKASKHPKEAALLVQFRTATERQIEGFRGPGRLLPSRYSAIKQIPELNEYPNNVFVQGFEYAIPRPAVAQYFKVSEAVQMAAQQVMFQGKTAKEAVKEAAAKIKAIVRK